MFNLTESPDSQDSRTLLIERHESQCPMIVIELNSDFEIINWSRGAVSQLGWSAEEMLGRTLVSSGIVHSEDLYQIVNLVSAFKTEQMDGASKARHLSRYENGFAPKNSWRFSSRFKSREGDFKTFEVACSLIPNHDESFRGLSAQHNISNECRKTPAYKFWAIEVDSAAERIRNAESASQVKSHFLANMSHEIRAPLGAILGFADLMAASETTPNERQEFLKIIERNGRHLSRLIDDILDLSKVEAGKMEIANEMVNPMTVIEEVLGYVGRKAQQNQVRMIVTSDSNVPSRIATDLVRFRQVVTNVVSNAVKFTEGGEVKIHMSMADSTHLKIQVRDPGRGIPESVRDQLFMPFARGREGGSATSPAGHGLGLVLSRKLARILGGDLLLTDTKEGEGSEFSILVSTASDSKSEMPSESLVRPRVTSEKISNDLAGYEILVVDDSRDSQALMQQLLRRRGAKVELASDGEEGLDKVRNHDWDVVLMDIQMPRVDGLEATKRLRAMGYKGVVIALTARAMNEERLRCFEAGCTDHFSKPVQSQGLIERIRTLVPHPHSVC